VYEFNGCVVVGWVSSKTLFMIAARPKPPSLSARLPDNSNRMAFDRQGQVFFPLFRSCQGDKLELHPESQGKFVDCNANPRMI
jgi:hypothetical protein